MKIIPTPNETDERMLKQLQGYCEMEDVIKRLRIGVYDQMTANRTPWEWVAVTSTKDAVALLNRQGAVDAETIVDEFVRGLCKNSKSFKVSPFPPNPE